MPVSQADLEMILGGLINKALTAAIKVNLGVLSSEDARAICTADSVRYSKAIAKMYDGTARIEDGKFVVDDDDADPRAGGQAVVPKGWRDGSSN